MLLGDAALMANLSNFPGGFDTPTDTFTGATSMAGVHAQHHDLLADSVYNMQKANPTVGLLATATGDGVTDDTAALQAAITAAGGTWTVTSPPGKTYLIASTITVSTSGARLDLNGSTIKKKSTMTTSALDLTGANVELRNLKVDGNKAGGATGVGIFSSGVGVVLENVSVSNAAGGYGVGCVSGTLTCRNVRSDNNGTAFGNCDGFAVSTTGVISLDTNCVATSNTRGGFFCNTTGEGSNVNGTFGRNAIAGVYIFRGDKGHSDFIYAYDNDYQNVVCDPGITGVLLSDWQFGTIIAVDQGLTGGLTSGANVEFIGAQRFHVGTIISRGSGGYALAFSGYATGWGSRDCSVGTLIANNTGGNDTDPGLTFQGNSIRNFIGYAAIRGHSWAVSISEEILPVGNDHNTIGELHAYNCPWGIAVYRAGSYNHIGKVVGRDCGTADATLSRGLIGFRRHDVAGGGNVRGNTIGFLDYKDTRATSTRPMSLVWCDSTESGNAVLDGIARDADANVIDENGGNQVTLRPMLRNTSVETFEAGWTNGADNLTAGQFVEGTKGRRVVSNTTSTANIFKTGLALNLSAMGTDEWFRWFVNLEVVSDKHASTPIFLRMGTDASNYFQWIVAPDALRVNGPQYLRARKGGFTTTGTPSWASIARIDFFAVSAAANTFAVTFDNLEQIYPDRYSQHIGGVLPHGLPVASGSSVVSTGKLYVNDAGTWKSATIA